MPQSEEGDVLVLQFDLATKPFALKFGADPEEEEEDAGMFEEFADWYACRPDMPYLICAFQHHHHHHHHD